MTTIDSMLDTQHVATERTTPRWLYALAVAVVALIAGAAGATLTHTVYPAQAGAVGPAGQAGPAGPAGAAGLNGAAATLNTDKVGLCWDYNYGQSGNVSYVSDVNLFAPTYNNGALSCSTGQFIPLTPTGPDGLPVKHYNVGK